MTGSPQLENGYLRIACELAEAFATYRIPGEQVQILWVIIRKTYGFNKKEEFISNSQFCEATGLNKSHICRAINGLIDKNIVAKKGNNKIPSYQLNKNYGTWKVLPKKVTVAKKGNSVAKKGNKVLPKKVPTKEIKETIQKINIYSDFDWLDLNLWKEFKKMRVKIKKPLTEYAEKRALIKLEEIIKQGYSQEEIISNSIENCWQSFYVPKDNGGSNGSGRNNSGRILTPEEIEERKKLELWRKQNPQKSASSQNRKNA